MILCSDYFVFPISVYHAMEITIHNRARNKTVNFSRYQAFPIFKKKREGYR